MARDSLIAADTDDVFTAAARRLETDLAYGRDVNQWVESKLDAFMWSKQREIALLTQENSRVGVRSCHDSGKSWLASALSCHHIDTHDAGSARLITTAPSQTQVKGVLWNEINGMFEKARDLGSPMKGRVTQTEWWIGSYMAGIGRKPNDYRAELFAGLHARYVFVVLDEADGLSHDMWEGIEALLTNRTARLFAIGNPLDPGSHFAGIDNDESFVTMKITAYDTPNFTGEVVPELLKDVLLSKEWVEGRRKVWGEDNPYWFGRVLAEYPPEALATIIRVAYIEACTTAREDDEIPRVGFTQLGVDVAGSDTGDQTVIVERRGDTALRVWKKRTSDDDAVEDMVVDAIHESGASKVCIDATGFGHFFTGRIRKRARGVNVQAINFAAAAEIKNADKSRKYLNMRAQLYWETGRELMRQGLINMNFVEEKDMIIADLTSARYVPESLNKIIQVEDKAEIRKRLGRSPDYGDAFLLAFHEGGAGGGGPTRLPDMTRYSFPTGAASLVRR